MNDTRTVDDQTVTARRMTNDAVQRYQKLLEEFPDHELARFSLGKAYYDLGDYAAAREQFAFALVRKLDWMAVLILLGKCEQALGNRDRAREAFKRALELAVSQRHEGPQAELAELLRGL